MHILKMACGYIAHLFILYLLPTRSWIYCDSRFFWLLRIAGYYIYHPPHLKWWQRCE